MWIYERRLLCPVNIRKPDHSVAEFIMDCLSSAPYETKAATSYISQRYGAPYGEVSGLLTDIGTEASILPTSI
ncbi:manganese catalase family protein [Anaerosporobacter faecicola]|uniref:manganese catalase family protein n=1 Tax=Anaerosporobacter faecicola TaxID=2718714 RepID=UPI00143A99C1|nr:manganese catalase family protein [Anaerosporobacter faecicola]